MGKNYQNYLKSGHWKTVKTNLYKLKAYRCFFCGNKERLNAHHITYENINNEKIEDLVYLCIRCHKKLHENTEEGKKMKVWLENQRKEWIKKKFTRHGMRSGETILAFKLRMKRINAKNWKNRTGLRRTFGSDIKEEDRQSFGDGLKK